MIVAVTGRAQVGKDTFGARLVERWGFKRLAFADALKDVSLMADPIVDAWGHSYGGYETLTLSEAVAESGWEVAKRRGDVRPFLQRLGVAVRDVLGETVWVDHVLSQIDRNGHTVVTDVRFPDEADALRRLGATVVRVTRPGQRPANGHISEVAMDQYRCDLRIINDGTIADLHRKVDGLGPFFISETPKWWVL